jgi:hypothetical protein
MAATNEPDRTCCCCDKKKVPVIFRCGDNQVMILTCDRCLDPVCRACCDEAEDGSVTCSMCLQNDAARS